MLGLKPGQTKVRYLVMLVPRLGSSVEASTHTLRRRDPRQVLVVIQVDVFREWRSFVHFQQIEREMFGPQRECLVEVAAPSVQCLARESRNQIETNIIETRVA